MPRNISFALTTGQFLAGTKTVTRRLGWADLLWGMTLQAVRKSQGLKKGEKVERLGAIRILDVRREPLELMLRDEEYGRDEARREGFPEMSAGDFVEFFCRTHRGCTPATTVTRIAFVRLP
jgi:hypothetical protein